MSGLAVATRPVDRDTDDLDLVAGVRAGDDRAFEVLFSRYQPRVAGYVRERVRDSGRAEDITQEVFMSALRRMRVTEREIVFKPWIYKIAENACIDAFRRASNTTEVSFDADDAIGAEDRLRLVESSATPDAAVEDKAALDNLCGALGELSRVHSRILVLRELEGLSYAEIGERLGMSRATVESTLFRARKRLGVEYAEIGSGERCLRVQRIVDGLPSRRPGLRDRRRMAVHLAHCQPCRRHARRAGLPLDPLAARPSGVAARIAAFVPLPGFLIRRWGGGEAGERLGAGAGGQVAQWSANAATVIDPAVAGGWVKTIATAATVALAGIGAGQAITDRMPAERAPVQAPALSRGAQSGGSAGAQQRSMPTPNAGRGSSSSSGRAGDASADLPARPAHSGQRRTAPAPLGSSADLGQTDRPERPAPAAAREPGAAPTAGGANEREQSPADQPVGPGPLGQAPAAGGATADSVAGNSARGPAGHGVQGVATGATTTVGAVTQRPAADGGSARAPTESEPAPTGSSPGPGPAQSAAARVANAIDVTTSAVSDVGR